MRFRSAYVRWTLLSLSVNYRLLSTEVKFVWISSPSPSLHHHTHRCSMMSDFERIRLVLLGGAGVGKSCIVRRFLTKTYCDKYKPTVEDLHNREYDLGSVTLKVRENCSLFRPKKQHKLNNDNKSSSHLGGHFGHFRWFAISGNASTLYCDGSRFPARLFGYVGAEFYGCEAVFRGDQRAASRLSGALKLKLRIAFCLQLITPKSFRFSTGNSYCYLR